MTDYIDKRIVWGAIGWGPFDCGECGAKVRWQGMGGARDIGHTKECEQGRCFETLEMALHANESEELSRLRRCAERWAHEQADSDVYNYCQHCRKPIHGGGPHAHDCDAAIILGLDREPA